MIDFKLLKKDGNIEVICHTEYIIGVNHHTGNSERFEEGKKYLLSIGKLGGEIVFVWISDFHGQRFSIDENTNRGVLKVCTDYFYDIYTHRNSEIDKILETI